MKINAIHITMFLLLVGMNGIAQQDNRHIRQGNSYYDEGQYKKAEIEYMKSAQSPKTAQKGIYNLGDALYMQNNYMQATAAFDSLRTFKLDDETRAKTYYNLGNSLLKVAIDSSQMAGQVLPQSIEAYKNSLRLNPQDADARYNLAYAQKMLQQNQQQQDQQNKDQQNKDQQNKDQQKQDQQKQDQKQNQDQQQQNQDQQKDDQRADQNQQQQQQQQGQPQQISKEDAERILEALKNDEKQTLEKLKEAQIQRTRVVKSEKDW